MNDKLNYLIERALLRLKSIECSYNVGIAYKRIQRGYKRIKLY